MTQGEAIAWWLRRLTAHGAYDALWLHELAAFDVNYEDEGESSLFDANRWYDSKQHMPVYTPAEIMRHPLVEMETLSEDADRLFLGFEAADAIHRVLWNMRKPPGDPLVHGIEKAFELNVASIEQYRGVQEEREDLGWADGPADYTYKEPTWKGKSSTRSGTSTTRSRSSATQ